MEITWYGHSCFRLAERSMATVVTDPYDHREVGLEALKLKADIVTVSHNKPGHNNLGAVKGEPYIISGPGEYEVGGVFITGIQTNGLTKKDEGQPRNTLYVIEYNGINIVHLGAMDRVPSQTEVEALGPVHIALVPVGGGSSFKCFQSRRSGQPAGTQCGDSHAFCFARFPNSPGPGEQILKRNGGGRNPCTACS